MVWPTLGSRTAEERNRSLAKDAGYCYRRSVVCVCLSVCLSVNHTVSFAETANRSTCRLDYRRGWVYGCWMIMFRKTQTGQKNAKRA